MALIGVLVVGEEIGWRGFALPRLLKTHRALGASLLLGLLWAGWHAPNFLFLDESSAYGKSFIAYCAWVIPFAVLMTWVFVNTKGSILVATLFHAAGNIAGPVFGRTLEVEQAWLFEGAAMAIMAVAPVIFLGPSLRGTRRATAAIEGRPVGMA
jgi:membrane protease YdiL (CAAX protease family)